MKRKFNITGSCNPELHYMADISEKIDQIVKLIEDRSYFTINRPHQYGKTTIQFELAQRINQWDDSIALNISFEEIDYEIYQSKKSFINTFLKILAESFESYSYNDLSDLANEQVNKTENFQSLSSFIGTLVQKSKKNIILIMTSMTIKNKKANPI